MRGAERVQLGQLGPEAGVPGRGGAGDERLRDRPERAERLLRHGSRPHRPPRRRAGAAVVLVADRGLTRRDQQVLGHHLTGAVSHGQQPPVLDVEADRLADQPGRDRVAGRAEPHAGQPVDLAGHRLADAGPQRRQRPSSSRSTTSRSAGTAQISLWIAALTSTHHARAAAFAAARSANGHRPGTGASGRSWRSRPGSPRSPSSPGRRPRRSPAGTRDGPRTARSPVSAPPRSRPPHPSGTPSGRPAPPPAPRRGPRSTPRAARAWSPRARRRRSARTGPATRPAPRRTRAARPAHPSR